MLTALVFAACAVAAQDPFRTSITGNELAECLQMGPYVTDQDSKGKNAQAIMAAFQKLSKLPTDELEKQMVECLEDGWCLERSKQYSFLQTLRAFDQYLFDVPREKMWLFTKSGPLTVVTNYLQASGPPPRPLTDFRRLKEVYKRRENRGSTDVAGSMLDRESVVRRIRRSGQKK
jgi:hypothetical protein